MPKNNLRSIQNHECPSDRARSEHSTSRPPPRNAGEKTQQATGLCRKPVRLSIDGLRAALEQMTTSLQDTSTNFKQEVYPYDSDRAWQDAMEAEWLQKESLKRLGKRGGPSTSGKRVWRRMTTDCRLQRAQLGVEVCGRRQSLAENSAPARTQSFPDDHSDELASPLRTVDFGKAHGSYCMVEIKSRDHKNKSSDDIMAQMWLSRCRRLYLGRHVRGRFDRDALFQGDIDSDLIAWQRHHEDGMACFTGLLEKIRTKVLQSAYSIVQYELAYTDNSKTF